MSELAFSVPGRSECTWTTAHGPVHGTLILPEPLVAIAILIHAGLERRTSDDPLAAILQHAGTGTLLLDLLTASERRYSDIQRNVPLLTQRLLDVLALFKQHMSLGDLPMLPIAFCAYGDCSPAAVRVAAWRDHDIFAVVCHGGMIDLAGMLYLRTLTSPLLVLVDADDQRLLQSNRRALREVNCPSRCLTLADDGETASQMNFSAFAARQSAQWLLEHLPRAA
ncbi:MAG TPA: hypothetical protein PKN13_11070 [Accumulibacter sp.]|nr:hypothetical protein [Accumulibacter sp.]HMW18397.1 hypothetical protein [Accumulibacter sp.]HMX22422.1 hypothetical protein [Accumulibacter sp.]HMY07086.1 hypothetical protein [Accumulibacter sp.]HNC18607.1 hypothetical protein [Accumulibacter sp.]